MKPKGKLLIIGGAEDKGEETMPMENKNIKFKRYEILKTLLFNTRHKVIEIITTGSRVPNEVRKSYSNAFKKMGYPVPNFMNIAKRDDTDKIKYIKRIKECGAIFFSGGDQSRLSNIFANTTLCDIIKKRFYTDPDFLLAGTSAGAMAMSDVMIQSGGDAEAMIINNLKLGRGLNFISNVIIDTHFIKRGRFARLALAVSLYPEHVGIGLGEDTALIITNGEITECRGSGMVVIINGCNIYSSNARERKKGMPIFVENLKVDILVKGTSYSLKKHKII